MKNAKKILLFALALVALTLVLSISIFAESKVVIVTTAADYFNAVNGTSPFAPDGTPINDGDIVRLGNPIELIAPGDENNSKGPGYNSYYYEVHKAITIDLNGFELTTHRGFANTHLKNAGCSIISSKVENGEIVRGTIRHTGGHAVVKVWWADRIENVILISDRKSGSAGGISMQSSTTTHINSIKNVEIKGNTLTYGIETYNCGNAVANVIDNMEGLDITANEYGMKICAPLGTATDCDIFGKKAGVFLWNKDVNYVSTITLEDCEVSGDTTALEVQIQIGNAKETTIKTDSSTTFTSTSGTAIKDSSYVDIDSSDLNFEVPGYVMSDDGVFSTCTDHTWADATCTAPKTCSNCKATEGEALPHNYVESDRVDAQPGVEGSVTYTCSVCGNTYSETIDALPEHTHTPVEIPEVLPTPSNVGYTAGVKCSECEEVLEAPVEIPALGINANYKFASANINLSESIALKFYVNIPAGYENSYVVFNFLGEDVTVTKSGEDTKNGMTRYIFPLAGILPIYMNETITATVYTDINGEVISKSMQYSVKKYCTTIIGNASSSVAFKTVVTDLLAYGEAAQIYVGGYTEDQMITNGVDMTYKTQTFEKLTKDEHFKLVRDGDVYEGLNWTGANLYAKDTITMMFYFTADDSIDLSKLQIKLTYLGKSEYISVEELKYDASKDRYEVKFTNIWPIYYDEIIDARFVLDGVEVGQYVQYSVNSYIYQQQDKTTTFGDFIRALSNYSKAVCEYVK